MTSNACTKLSYQEIKASGYLGKAQGMYLMVFMESEAMTHLEATHKVFLEFGVRMPARNSRLSELEHMGFLKKVEKRICPATNNLVNQWIWTGRTSPFEGREEWVECEGCHGKGGHMKKVYREVPLKDLFKG